LRREALPIQKPSKIINFIVNSESLIVKTALRTLEIERDTLNGLVSSIDRDFVASVEAIHALPGRLVVTGIGKSALIGQKIVATLNSTGTPALFMHAADAIHGDLGMIQSGDGVLCLSKSGETPEIKVLLPLVKSMGNILVGMVATPDSYLGRHADFLLLTPCPREADPNNLAPTASTTAQVAMGDALAATLLALRGFTPRDFAQFHPGGSLGKQLYLRACDIYPNNERPSVHLDDSIQRTILEMTSKRLGATAVLDDQEQLKGIITDGDLRRMLERASAINGLKARDIMTGNPKTIHKDALAVKVLEMMRRHSITQVLVIEGTQYLGMVHLHDLIREGII
jgi:arabinose-5-phosphate isomerase